MLLIYKHKYPVIIAVSILLLMVTFIMPTTIYARRVSLPTKYVLYGVASLEYEKEWVSDSNISEDYFTQNYQLGITGPIIDPRLVTFDINGTFTDRSSDINSSLKGFNATLRLLNFGLVKKERYNYLNYLPRPVVLRYSRYDGSNFESTSYGISTGYYLPFNINLFGGNRLLSFRSIFAQPQRLKFNQQINSSQNENANGNANGNANANNGQQQSQQIKKIPYEGINIPFPVINFDFDRNIYKSEDYKTVTTVYDTRMRFGSKKYEYTLGYFFSLNEDSRNPYDREQNVFTIDTKNKLSAWVLENRFRKEKTAEINTFNSHSLDTRLYRYFQKDLDTSYSLSFGGGYRQTEGYTGNSESKNIGAGGTMSKKLSPYLRSNTGLFINYQETSNNSSDNRDSTYNLNISETLNYSGFRGILFTGSLNGGYSDEVVPYGASLGFITTKWRRLNLSGHYQYDAFKDKDNDTYTQKHQLRYNASAMLRQNMSINAGVTNSIALIDDKYHDISYSERTQGFDLHLKWFYRRHNIDISGNITRTTTTNPATSTPESNIYGYRILYNTSFIRRTLYSIYFTQDIDKTNDKSVADLKTAFSWYYGKFMFTADYELKNTKDNQSDVTEHRIFLKVSRYFRKIL